MSGILPSFTWSSSKEGTKNASASGTPSKGCKYNFTQNYSKATSNIAYAKSGMIELTLSQSGYNGKKAQVISQYCHKVLAVGNISIGASPSISTGEAYNTTDTDNTTNTIYY